MTGAVCNNSISVISIGRFSRSTGHALAGIFIQLLAVLFDCGYHRRQLQRNAKKAVEHRFQLRRFNLANRSGFQRFTPDIARIGFCAQRQLGDVFFRLA